MLSQFKHALPKKTNLIHKKTSIRTKCCNLQIPTISLEMPVPSQGYYGFHSFPVVD